MTTERRGNPLRTRGKQMAAASLLRAAYLSIIRSDSVGNNNSNNNKIKNQVNTDRGIDSTWIFGQTFQPKPLRARIGVPARHSPVQLLKIKRGDQADAV